MTLAHLFYAKHPRRPDAAPGSRRRVRRSRSTAFLEPLEPRLLLSSSPTHPELVGELTASVDAASASAGLEPAAVNGIDLVVTAASASSTALAGQTVSVSWTVANQGTVAASGYWMDRLYLSRDEVLDVVEDYRVDARLATWDPAGGSYTVGPVNATLPLVDHGAWSLLFATDVNIDGTSAIAEADETNNVRALPITIQAPDLAVSSVTAPATGVIGDPISVSWTVTNESAVDAIADWSDRIYLSTDQAWSEDDTFVDTESIVTQTPLAPRAGYTVTRDLTVPFGVSAGSGYLLLVTDVFNAQRETEENNNVHAVPITLVPAAPDLVVSAVSAPATIQPGEQITVSWTVTNQGTRDASAGWYDVLGLSRDDTWGAGDVSVHSEWIAGQTPLAPGASYTLTRSVTVSPYLEAGAWNLLVMADAWGYQGEADEANNARIVPVTTPAADLAVSGITAPDSTQAGETVTVSRTVTNEGAVDASADWYDAFYLSRDQTYSDDDAFIEYAYVTIPPLAPGASYTADLAVTMPAADLGAWYLLVVADRYGHQIEMDESDNTGARPITMAAPDLVVTAASAPPSALAGERMSVTWTVRNQGGAPANEDWVDAVYLSLDATPSGDDALLSNPLIAAETPLAPGASYTSTDEVTVPFGTASGSWHLLFIADRFGYQREADDDNNVFDVPITIGAPDLTVTTASAPSNTLAGETISVSWAVTNQGSVAAPRDWHDALLFSRDQTPSADDVVLGTVIVASETPLAPGASYPLARTVTVPSVASGTWYVLVVTDRDDEQSETDEANNLHVLGITVGSLDLQVSALGAPGSAVAGERVTVNWTVENVGPLAATADWFDRIYLSSDQTPSADDRLVHTQWVAAETPLAPGTNYAFSRQVTIPQVAAGDWYLLVVADRDNAQGEENEGNNAAAVPVTIAVPDLVVSAFTAPSSAVVDELMAVAWTVENQGAVPAFAGWLDVLSLSSDLVPGDDDVLVSTEWIVGQTPLDPGASYGLERWMSVPRVAAGDWYLLVAADRYATQSEVEEANNVAWSLITIGVPDLRVTAASVPASMVVGEWVSLEWTVTNEGSVPAPADWRDVVYLSHDQTPSSDDIQVASEPISNFMPLDAGASYTVARDVAVPHAEAGAWYVLVVADLDDRQGETDETDNVLVVPATVAAANLTVTAASAPASATVFETVSVTWTVTNADGAPAPSQWDDALYLSRDEVLDGEDAFLGSAYIWAETPLAPSASYTRTLDVTLPRQDGAWYVLVVVDRSDDQGETDETDNVRALPLQVSGPDLVVEALTAPDAARLGDAIDVAWTVRNAGSGAVVTGWRDRVWFSTDATLDQGDLQLAELLPAATLPLAAGDAHRRSVSVTLPLSGDFAVSQGFVLVETDAIGSVLEVLEGNNVTTSAAMTLTLPPLPDLVISDVSAPLEAFTGQEVPISWTVTNTGPGATRGGWDDALWVSSDGVAGDDERLGTFRFDGVLGPGQSITRTQMISLPVDLEGDRWLAVVTDEAGEVFEAAGEANNTAVDDRSVSVRIQPLPNLQVTGVTAPSESFSSQQTVVEWVVTNAGTGPTSAPAWRDAVYLSVDPVLDDSDRPLGDASNPSYLAPGESYRQSLAVTLPHGIDGPFYFLVAADTRGDVFEYQAENDNTGAGGPAPVHLTPPPDLVVTVAPPPPGFSGQPLTLAWTVTNQGVGRTLGRGWFDHLYMSEDGTLDAGDRLLKKVLLTTPLEAGASYGAAATVTLPVGVTGDFFFVVRTDGDNNVYEHASEDNNTASASGHVTLTPPPDLEVPRVVVPATALAGQALTIEYEVANFGASATPNEVWDDAFFLSTDTTLDAGDLPLRFPRMHYGGLSADASHVRSATFTLPDTLAGAFHVIVVADSTNVVFEADNANNAGVSPGVVTIDSRPPDLEISALDMPAIVTAGTAMRVRWEVRNTGAGPTAASRWADRVVLGTDAETGETLTTIPRLGALDAGESYSRDELITVPLTLAGGLRLFIVTDEGQSVFEANDENNAAFRTITVVRDTADLQVAAVTAPPDAMAGGTVAIDWTVMNLGSRSAGVSYWYDDVFLSLDAVVDPGDTPLGQVRRVNDLAAGASYAAHASFAIPYDLAPGTYRVLVRTDRDDQVVEVPNEGNNVQASAPIVIVPELRANLVVSGADAPAEGVSGQPFSVAWTVENTGSAPAAGPWYDTVYLSRDQVLDAAADVALGSVDAPGLAAGASYTASTSFVVPRGLTGPFYVFVVTAGGGRVREDAAADNIGYDPVSMLVSLAPPADLVAGSITVPANATPGREATIDYTVRNESAHAARGAWYDALYASADAAWDPGDPLLGRVLHRGDVAPGGSYSERLIAALPGMTPGQYHVIVRSDILDHLPEASETNNVGASIDQTAVDAEALVLGAPASGTLGEGQAAFYRLDVPAGEALRLRLDSAADIAGNELYLRLGAMPSRGQFDVASRVAFSPDQEVSVPSTGAGTYYVLVFAASVSGAPEYSLLAETVSFSLTRFRPTQVGNDGASTLEVHGALFGSDTRFELVAPASGSSEPRVLAAERVFLANSGIAFVTFDLFDAPTGLYDLRAVQPAGGTAVVDDTVAVVDGDGGRLAHSITGHAEVRPDRASFFTVDYANVGDADLAAPLFLITGEVPVGFSTEAMTPGTLQALGASPDGPLEILRPGARSTIPVVFRSPAVEGQSIRIRVQPILATDESLVDDWGAVEAAIRPASIPDEQWAPFWGRIQPRIGSTWGDYVGLLHRLVTLLSEPGDPIRDVRQLFATLYAYDPMFRPSSALSGRLLDAASGAPIASMEISAYRVAEDGRFVREGFEITDAEGRFTFPRLHPGTYQLGLPGSAIDMDRDGVLDAAPPHFTVTGEADVSDVTVYIDPVAEPSVHVSDSDAVLVTGPDGAPHLLWRRDGIISHARFDGTGWVDATGVSDAPGYALDLVASPTLIDGAAPGLLATWVQGDGNEAEIYYAVARAGEGGSVEWSDPVQLTDDAVTDDAPSAIVAASGTVLITSLKQDSEATDDRDVYFHVVDVASGSLIWSASVPAAVAADALEPLGNQFSFSSQLSLPPLPKWLGDLSGSLALQYSGSTSGCEASLELSIGGSLVADGDARRTTGQVTGAGAAKFVANETTGDWKLVRSTGSFAAQASTDMKHALLRVLQRVPYPAVSLSALALELVLARLKIMSGIEIEEGVTLSVGLNGEGTWFNRLPFSDLSPDVGELGGTVELGPYIRVARGSTATTKLWFEGRESKLSGSVSIGFSLFPTLSIKSVDLKANLAAQLGPLVAQWQPSLGLFAASEAELGVAASLQLSQGDAALVFTRSDVPLGSGAVYGTNSLLADVSADVVEESAPSLASGPDGRIFAAWAKDADASSGYVGSSVFVADFDGASWSAPVELPGSFGLDSDVNAIVDGSGRRLAVWSMADASALDAVTSITLDEVVALRAASDLVYSVFDGTVWRAPQVVQATAGADGSVALARDPDGRVVLAWITRGTDELDHLHAATWDGSGWTLGPAVAAASTLRSPAPGRVGRDTTLFWTQDTNPDRDRTELSLFSSVFDGASWSTPTLFDPLPPASANAIDAAAAPASAVAAPTAIASRACACCSRSADATDADGAPPTELSPEGLFSFLPPVPEDCLKKPDPDDPDGGGGGSGGWGGYGGGGSDGGTTPPGGRGDDGYSRPRYDKDPNDYDPVVVRPLDPNDIIGPEGFGDERWVRSTDRLPYTIRFENAAIAQAPAQRVVVTQQLDADLDPRTFRVDDFGWGDVRVELPGDAPFFNERLDLRDRFGFFVDVSASIDVTSGVATWTITTIDPATGEQPVDALTGFLPPDDASGRGEGFVSYSVRPRRTTATGAVVDAQARIVFDTEAPIDTPPIFNTVDGVAPSSAIEALPAVTTTPEFVLRWAGTDDADGSAIADFTVFVSEDGGPLQALVERTTATELTFTGVEGRRYAFYSAARDNSGNREAVPADPDAQILLAGDSAEIRGVKFEDVDGDGVRDPEEPGLPGWTIFLDTDADGVLDPGEQSTITDAAGQYAFTLLPPGSYVVAEAQQPGWVQTAPGAGGASANAESYLTTTGADVQLDTPGALVTADVEPAWAATPASAHRWSGLDDLRADPRFSGLDGDGVTAVVIDTGIDVDHAFFGPDADRDGVADRVVYQWDFADGDPDASDRSGHGSMVASVVGAQDGTYGGVAPGVDLVVLKVFEDAGRGYFSYLERALQWVVEHGREYGVGVVNLSLGDGGNWLAAVSQYGLGDELAALAAQDVIVVAAAGNRFSEFGSVPGLAYPASDPAVLAIGATWTDDFGGPWRFSSGAIDYETAPDRIASFSQRHASLIDTFAPGARLTGASATGGIVTMQGTSQASAYIAGAAVLAQQLAQDTLGRRLDTAELAALLRATGDRIVDGDDEQDNVVNTGLTFPRLDLLRLAEAIVALGSGETSSGDSEPPVDGGGAPPAPSPSGTSGAHSVTLAPAQVLTGVDFGNFALGDLGGVAFHDLDGDGVRDEGEPGLQGWTVYLDRDGDGHRGATEPAVTTDLDGRYVFNDLGPGTYTVRQVTQLDWLRTTPAGGHHEIVMTSGLGFAAADFGDRQVTPAPRVASFTPTSTGFRVELDRPVDVSVVNLYDAQLTGLGPADATLVGATRGPIRGSLVSDASGTVFTFVRTGGILEPDTYTVTLRSAADGFAMAGGTLMDGDTDGLPGDDFTAAFTIAPSSGVVVSVPDVMRGPGQPADVAATVSGIPIRLSDGAGVGSVEVTVLYDLALLEVTGIGRGDALPLDAVVHADLATPGRIVLHVTAPSGLSAGAAELAWIEARVPASAPLGMAQLLDVAAVSLNAGALPALDDDAMHVAGYLGDTTMDGAYTREDAQDVLRVAVRRDSGFVRYSRIDPVVVADITGNGAISSLDATRVLQEAIGADRPEIPALPSAAGETSVVVAPAGNAAAPIVEFTIGALGSADRWQAEAARLAPDRDERLTATSDGLQAPDGIDIDDDGVVTGGSASTAVHRELGIPAAVVGWADATATETVAPAAAVPLVGQPRTLIIEPAVAGGSRSEPTAGVTGTPGLGIDWSSRQSLRSVGLTSVQTAFARLSFALSARPDAIETEADVQEPLVDWDADAAPSLELPELGTAAPVSG